METTQRDAFFNALFKVARKNSDIIVLTADCGAPSLDHWREELPCQFINVGIAEQNMIAVAAGLALSGKRPYCYAIAPFATLRCYEFIKVDLCLMNLPVVIVGVGAGLSYNEAGPTHHATEDIAIMRVLPNMEIVSIIDNETASAAAEYPHTGPMYLRLDRGDGKHAPHIIFKPSNRTWYPIFLKPFFMPFPKGTKQIITVEEHQLAGGLGSIVAEYLADNNINIPLKRIAIEDEYFYKYGTREDIWTGKE